MNVIKLSSSLLATTGLLFTSLPAFAGPFDTVSPGIFATPGTLITPGTVGAGTVGTAETTPEANQSENVGNSEVQGLGDHDSWVSQDLLVEDPRALCSDVGLGNNTVASSLQSSNSSSSSSRNTSSSASSGGGGGGVSILGIGVSGSGQRSDRSSNSNSQNHNNRESTANTFESSTVEVGQNCDAFVEAAAARDMNYEDNLTERYRIRSGRRGEQVDSLLER
ncbi:MAG: Protein of unknown function (DUF515) [Phormidesmis priestleyi Ana]|uniref:Uncharacterized protein n=1 Tax=Phormidesmis priestleyi Ana TaxID=1666911 RepID=A0A0P7ZF16_9CYAN|nr:MAG: Protein of unknown function (DUF515) [Phormidesmis priestleyi Ana]